MADISETSSTSRVRITEPDDNFRVWREAIAAALKAGGTIEFNTLTPTGKQAALSLLRRRSARLVKDDDTLIVETRPPNYVLRVLTAGLLS